MVETIIDIRIAIDIFLSDAALSFVATDAAILGIAAVAMAVERATGSVLKSTYLP